MEGVFPFQKLVPKCPGAYTRGGGGESLLSEFYGIIMIL